MSEGVTQNGKPAYPLDMIGAKPVGVETRRQIRELSRGVIAWRKPEVVKPSCREKLRSVDYLAPVPQTDTGRRVEYTKVNGRTLSKELGNMIS
jgi:hypothetical protein